MNAADVIQTSWITTISRYIKGLFVCVCFMLKAISKIYKPNL